MDVLNLSTNHKLGIPSTDQANIATFNTKRQALAFAKSQGHLPLNVHSAANRFWQFWAIYQESGEILLIVRKDGTILELPWPGFF
jgi:putative heme iron utilization protein